GTCPACRPPLLVWRAGAIWAIWRRSLAIRVRIRRRSSSILVSPGPREPIPAPPATRPPACRDIESPQPRSRGSRYSSWASSTCALPSLDLACWAKMSRIRAVRSMTLTLTTSSRPRRWEGASSESTITVSAPVVATTSASSPALPEPMKVPGSGAARRCSMPSSTWDPAVSASAASSRGEISAAAVLGLGDVHELGDQPAHAVQRTALLHLVLVSAMAAMPVGGLVVDGGTGPALDPIDALLGSCLGLGVIGGGGSKWRWGHGVLY